MMLNLLIRYKFSILVAIVIALLSLIPGNSMPDSSLFSIPALDKIGHFSMYAFLGFVALLESHCKPSCFRFHTLLLLCIFSLSIIIEVLQATVVSTRSAEWLDLLANASGLLSGYLAFRVLRMVRS
ncbi:MAG TPA: hypothetical protein ENO05_03815 [Bacteroides sp.]|nr:hypothetical protein [Bacteroides sp.]